MTMETSNISNKLKNVQCYQHADLCFLPILWLYDLKLDCLSPLISVLSIQATFLSQHDQADIRNLEAIATPAANESAWIITFPIMSTKTKQRQKCWRQKYLIQLAKQIQWRTCFRAGSNISSVSSLPVRLCFVGWSPMYFITGSQHSGNFHFTSIIQLTQYKLFALDSVCIYETRSQVGNICSRSGEKHSWLHYGSAGGQNQNS